MIDVPHQTALLGWPMCLAMTWRRLLGGEYIIAHHNHRSILLRWSVCTQDSSRDNMYVESNVALATGFESTFVCSTLRFFQGSDARQVLILFVGL